MAADACQLSPCQDGGTLNAAHLPNQGRLFGFQIIAFEYAYSPCILLVGPVIYAAFETHRAYVPVSLIACILLQSVCLYVKLR